ncbi:hypothetical protein LJC60_01965 [Ruminococcaceae bacterium OttesenSCG-928-D13]|nr:hypothetical protein [Ruminococcaceae bacterium OttesenSCG-928-D13]
MNPFLYRSEYRLNDDSDDIVYYSEAMDAYIRVTKAQFLADNPTLTEQDFEYYKKWSDDSWHEIYKNDRSQGRRRSHSNEAADSIENLIDRTAVVENDDVASVLKTILTPTQHRRFILNAVYGFSTVEIAEMEGCNQSVISRSISVARSILKKYFSGIA